MPYRCSRNDYRIYLFRARNLYLRTRRPGKKWVSGLRPEIGKNSSRDWSRNWPGRENKEKMAQNPENPNFPPFFPYFLGRANFGTNLRSYFFLISGRRPETHFLPGRRALKLRRTVWQKAPVKKKIVHFLAIFVQNGCATTLFLNLSSRRRGASSAEAGQNDFIEDSDVRTWSLFVLGF